MIKVLFIHNCLVCGGAEQALFDLICLLDKTKFDATVLVQIDGGMWEQKFRDAGIRVLSIWDAQKVTNNPLIKLNNLLMRKRIINSIKRNGEGLIDNCFQEHFDIVVSYAVWENHEIGFTKNAKTVKFIHGDVDTNQGYRDNIMNSVSTLKRFDHIICVSQTARNSFERLTGITANVSVHFNPLDNKHILESKKSNKEKNTIPMICAVGRLVQEKGFDRLIRLHKKILEDGILHELVVVGDGPERDKLEKMAMDSGESRVTMIGYSSNPYYYMDRSDFVVCPSKTEGLSLIGMEALVLGVPVVSAVPTIGELFGDELCGIVTDNDDDSLESGIRKMLTDREFYQETKEAAKRRSKFFDGRRMVKEIEEEFIKLLNDE